MLTLYLLSSVTQQAKMLRGVIDRPSGRFRHAPSCYLLEVLVRIVKRLNHNVVLCLDSKGREVVALGLGVGFPTDGEDLDVARIDRTFYGVDERYMALFEEIPFDILEFAAQMADVVRGALSYELSPNYPLALADHIAFMVDRRRKNLAVPLPYSSEFARLYPAEWRIAAFVAERAERYFHLVLPVEETAGIAFGILGAAGAGDAGQDAPNAIESRIDDVVASVERQLQVQIDRSGIAYARFASHCAICYMGFARTSRPFPNMVRCSPCSRKARLPWLRSHDLSLATSTLPAMPRWTRTKCSISPCT